MEAQLAGTWTAWLESSAMAVAMREWTMLYPVVEIAHIVGFVLLVGAAFMFDLRLLGCARSLPVSPLADHLLRPSRAALTIVLPTGLLMFAANATTMIEKPVFQLKLLLIAFAGLNALAFRLWISRTLKADRDTHSSTPLAAKLSAVFSLVVWTAVISCGRLIAFL